MIVTFKEGKPSKNLYFIILAIAFTITTIVAETADNTDIKVFIGFIFMGWLIFGSFITDSYIRKQRKGNK